MNLAILGATGSIGTQTLDVIRACLPETRVSVLTGNSNIDKLAILVDEFSPDLVWVPDNNSAEFLYSSVTHECEILTGSDGLLECAGYEKTDTVVNALTGRAGLAPALAAIKAGKNIALANKETLVSAGELVIKAAREHGVKITPIDSEHSAIWQCLQGNENNRIEKIILTASGGPFRTWPFDKIKQAKAKDALKHPNWEMGAKITIDSATLMNKGLEFIEAMRLFGVSADQIEVLIHPQSIIHSMVQFEDGSVMAQMGLPDMRLPILYALTGPRRYKNNFGKLDLLAHNSLTFEKPDTERFPCLALAQKAAVSGGTRAVVMNTINELAVNAYLKDEIPFYGISSLIEDAFRSYTNMQVTDIRDIWEAEAWAEAFFERR